MTTTITMSIIITVVTMVVIVTCDLATDTVVTVHLVNNSCTGRTTTMRAAVVVVARAFLLWLTVIIIIIVSIIMTRAVLVVVMLDACENNVRHSGAYPFSRIRMRVRRCHETVHHWFSIIIIININTTAIRFNRGMATRNQCFVFGSMIATTTRPRCITTTTTTAAALSALARTIVIVSFFQSTNIRVYDTRAATSTTASTVLRCLL